MDSSDSLKIDENLAHLEDLIFECSARDASIVLLPELFEGTYFCREETDTWFRLARPLDDHPTIARFSQLAREMKMVFPVSFFEKDGQEYYNSVAIVDADGSVLGRYRKSHIPDGPGYEEKYYFRPGDTGFRAWQTRAGTIGVGICWDQWYPECARAMALQGAEMLLYPTAIGSEPVEVDNDTRDPWQRAMIGHAVSNAMPVAAANRIGTEDGQSFYGRSFITDETGAIVSEVERGREGVAVAAFDRAALDQARAAWGFFRDRRPDLYRPLTE